MIIKLVNAKRELIGIRRIEKYNGELIKVDTVSYRPIKKEDYKIILKKSLNKMNEYKEELDAQIKKERHKKSLTNFLNKMSKLEYLTVEDMIEAVKMNSNLVYMYDLISCLEDIKATKKGLRVTDARGNKVYFYPKDTYKFYKCNFIGMI